jgi:ABC-2 type transport system ATP-binding protein
MTVQTAVEAIGLEKAYGDMRVLDGVDLRVAHDSAFVLLGPNGAGETTTVKILSTPVAANRRSARVAGYDVATDPDRATTRAARSNARNGA